MADPSEPLFTMAVVADMLQLDPQALRRLGAAARLEGQRPSGNQRRYSRDDVEVLSRAADLSAEGNNPAAIHRIMELERRLGERSAGGGRADGSGDA
jgi:DNA-binding transcriptional MerR regulator